MRHFLLFLTLATAALAQDQNDPRGFVFTDQNAEPITATVQNASTALAPELFAQKHTYANGAGIVDVGTRPVWYADHADGTVRRLKIAASAVTDSVDGEAAFEEQRNLLQYRGNANGVNTVRIGPYILRWRLNALRIEDNTTNVLRKATTSVRPASLTKDATSTVISYPSMLPYISTSVNILPGSVKENIVVNSLPDSSLLDSEVVLFVHQYDASRGATITPSINATTKDLEWKNNGGNIVLRQRVPYVFDAAGNDLNARYILRAAQTAYAIAVPARALRLATYPVTIDPYVDTVQADCTANRYTWEEGGTHDIWSYAWMKFALPSMSGNQVDTAIIWLWISAYEQPPNLIYNAKCDITGAWTESSTRTTLEALSFNGDTQTGISDDGNTLGGFDALSGASIFGEQSRNGISKIYKDSSTPSACTVKFIYTSPGATDSVGTGIKIGEQNYDGITWAPRSDATFFPWVRIYYSSTSMVRPVRRNGSVGMIQ